MLVGMPEEIGAMTVQMMEAQFPKGWVAAKSATAAEAATAKSLLSQWKDGGVVFGGPATLTGRRAFRMTKHPATVTTTTATPAPVARPTAPPAATVPASFPAPAAAPAAAPAPAAPAPTTTLPEVLITADQPAAAPSPAPGRQVTTVRRGEGLANVAKRLGRPATGASAAELRAANVPQGPDAQWSAAKDGNLKKAGRAGGLQPGDRLFVPTAWSPVDAARL